MVESGHLAKSRWSVSDERETFGELICNGCNLLVRRMVWGRGAKEKKKVEKTMREEFVVRIMRCFWYAENCSASKKGNKIWTSFSRYLKL